VAPIDDGPPDLTSMNLRSSVAALAVPAVLRMLLQTLVGIAALMIVGRLSPEAIAAVGLGNRVMFFLIGSLTALTVGSTALVAKYTGAGDAEEVSRVAGQSLLLALLAGGVIALAGILLAEPIMRAMVALQEDVDLEVVHLGAVYIRWLVGSMFLAIVLFMSNAIFQGAGDMRTPLYIMAAVNVLNVALAYALVLGPGPLPSFGVAGAGMAGAVARTAGGVVALALLLRGRSGVKLRAGDVFSFRPEVMSEILRIGLPSAVENMIRQSSQVIYTVLIAGLGTVSIAANAITMSALSLSFMPGFGFGLAATALVGQNLGAAKPDRAEASGYEALRWCLYLMSLLGVLFFLFPSFIVGLYTDDPAVIDLASSCLRVIAVAQPFLAVIMTLSGGLRGAGDTRWVMYVTAAGNWGIRLVGAWLIGFRLGMGLVGVWVAMALDQAFRAGLIALRFRSGRWKTALEARGRVSEV